MNVKWIFNDGATKVEYPTFPLAFRAMFMTIKQGVEKGKRKYNDMVKQMTIVSPMNDRMTGKPKVYSYFAATQFARDLGVLTPDGQLNSREYKKY